MADSGMQQAEQRQMERESAGRMKGATSSPLQTTGHGGFQSNAPGSGSAIAAPAPGTTDGGLSGGVIHSGAMEQNIHDKALGGGVITNDDLSPHSYLGHFGNDSVLRQGHNVGHKKIGKQAAVTGGAKRGYFKLPGTGANQIGHARYGDAPTGLPPSAPERKQQADIARALKRSLKGGSDSDTPAFAIPPTTIRKIGTKDFAPNTMKAMPPTTSNKKMSIKHEQDRIAFNMRHAKDHTRDAQAAKKRLQQIRKSKPPKG